MAIIPNGEPAFDQGAARLLTVKEFSLRYRRSRSRTYELIRSGELTAVKEGRSTLIPVDAAEVWARTLSPVSNSGTAERGNMSAETH